MIDDVDHPRMKRALLGLHERLANYLRQRFRPLDETSIRELTELIADHRKNARHALGVKFPVLTALVFPRFGYVDFVRADMSQEDIETTIVNCTVKYKNITREEVAWAIKHAFPDYKPRLLQ